MNDLAEIIRSLRGDESLRQASKRVGLSHNYLRTLEKGIDPRSGAPVRPSVDALRKIASAYLYPYEKLLRMAGYIESNAIPEWATKKDSRDFKRMLEDDQEVLFDGVPLDAEDKQRIHDVLTGLFWEAKWMNKHKRTKARFVEQKEHEPK